MEVPNGMEVNMFIKMYYELSTWWQFIRCSPKLILKKKMLTVLVWAIFPIIVREKFRQWKLSNIHSVWETQDWSWSQARATLFILYRIDLGSAGSWTQHRFPQAACLTDFGSWFWKVTIDKAFCFKIFVNH